MSNQINLDLIADTSQAEKAISDLTKDVDKLQKKAASTQFKSGKGSSYSTRSAPQQQVNNVKAAKGVKSFDLSDLKSSFSSLGSQISALSGGLGEATNQINSFADTLVKLAIAYKALGVKSPIPVPSSQRYRTATEWRKGSEAADRHSKAKYDSYMAQAEKETDPAKKQRLLAQASMHQLSGGYYSKSTASVRGVEKYERRLQSVERRLGPAELNGYKLTPRQRFERGYAQWTNKGPALASRIQGPYALKGGRLAGMGNMIRGGLGMTPELIGRAGGWAAGGGIGRLAGAALSNPYVLAGTAVAAAATAPYLYSASQVKKGRQKAEDLTDLETQFKNLSKNIAGVEVDALSKDLQKLAIEGAVPVQELSKGASMLMLAFKGNQKETSKWTSILADMSAGTGQSVEYFAELITKANQFGTVEFEVFNQLNEKGIPIIDQLKGKFGDTREEIMKAAQEGKITAAEFMKAFEAAHKVSMEGANARKAAASRLDIQNQTKQYEELEAANVTRGYDDAQMEYDKARRDRAKRRSEDEHIIATSEALGDALGDLVEVCRTVGDGISDAFEGAMHWIADVLDWDEDHAVATQDRMVKNANNLYYDAMEETATSQGVESAILKLEKDVERLNNQAGNDEFDDDTRARARDRAKYLEGIIETLDKRAKDLAKKEAIAQQRAKEAEERRTREESRKKASAEYAKFKEKLPETEEEWLKLSGQGSYNKLDNRIKWLQKRLEDGYADESEFEEMERLFKIREEIDKLRKELAKEAEDARKEAEREKKEAEKRAAEERKLQRKRDDYLLEDKVNDYSKRYEAEKELKYHKEAEKLRKKGYSEDAIERKLGRQDLVKRPAEDYKSKYELAYNREAEKMREMGFTQQQIEVKLKADKKDDLYSARGRLAANEEKIKREEENIKNSKMTGKEGIENAWGSVGRVITSFTSPYEQSSLKELKEINKNLKSEINAIKGIDTKSKAQ